MKIDIVFNSGNKINITTEHSLKRIGEMMSTNVTDVSTNNIIRWGLVEFVMVVEE